MYVCNECIGAYIIFSRKAKKGMKSWRENVTQNLQVDVDVIWWKIYIKNRIRAFLLCVYMCMMFIAKQAKPSELNLVILLE